LAKNSEELRIGEEYLKEVEEKGPSDAQVNVPNRCEKKEMKE